MAIVKANDFFKSGTPTVQPTAPATPPVAPKKPGAFEGLKNDFAKLGEKQIADVKEGADVFQQGTDNANPIEALAGLGRVPLRTLGNIGSGVGDIFLRSLQGAYNTVVPDEVKPKVEEVAKDVIKPIAEAVHPVVQPLVDKYNQLVESHPDVAKNIDSILGLTNIIGGKVAESGIVAATDEAKNAVVKGTEDAFNSVKNKIGDVIPTSKEAVVNKFKEQSVKDWNRIGADFAKSDKILNTSTARGKDIPSFLTDLKITPGSLVRDGAFDRDLVESTAEKLSTTSVEPYEATMNKLLDTAQAGAPKVKLNDWYAQALENVRNVPNSTVGQTERNIADLKKEFQALKRKYGDEIDLGKLNREKQTYWSNTKFDSTRPYQKDINYAIGRAAKDSIESTATDAPVKELNQLLGDYYESAKFLRSLSGKVPKDTFREKLLKGGLKAAGAIGGESIMGMGGGIGGYFVGKSLGYMLENASDALKSYILKDLQETTPEAYKKAIKYLGEKEAKRLQTPLLEAPKPLGSPENPIITPAPTTYEAPAQRINYRRLNGGKNSNNSTTKIINTTGIDTSVRSSEPKGKGLLSSAVENLRNPAKRQGGYIANPFYREGAKTAKQIATASSDKSIIPVSIKRIPKEDLYEMSDFTDFIAGEYKPKSKVQAEIDARRIAERYGINPDLTNKALASKFSKVLEKLKFRRSA